MKFRRKYRGTLQNGTNLSDKQERKRPTVERIETFSKMDSIMAFERKIAPQIFPQTLESFIVFERPWTLLLYWKIARACNVPTFVITRSYNFKRNSREVVAVEWGVGVD